LRLISAEENGLRACFFAALGYAATQMVKVSKWRQTAVDSSLSRQIQCGN
jgi:hypothetical protein